MEHLANKTWPKPNGKWVKMSQASKQGSKAAQQSTALGPGITVELCMELCSKDASCVYSFCNYKTPVGQAGRGRGADFIVMALMKMLLLLLQSFLA